MHEDSPTILSWGKMVICFTTTLEEHVKRKLKTLSPSNILIWWVWSLFCIYFKVLVCMRIPKIHYNNTIFLCLSLFCTLQPCFLWEVQSQFSLQIWFLCSNTQRNQTWSHNHSFPSRFWFLCAVLQSGPWHHSMCTYCRSHALTSLKGIFVCIMLCRCLFVYDEGPVFFF